MTTALKVIQGNPASVTEAQRLRPLLISPLKSLDERNEVAATVANLEQPASPLWILARVAALLSPYFEKDTPKAVRDMEAEDWLAALEGKPEWAITAAVRWWMGEDNEHRRKRPMQGDIAARIHVETEALRAGKIRVAAFDAGQLLPKPAEPERKTLSADERAALAASLGLPEAKAKPFPQQGAAI